MALGKLSDDIVHTATQHLVWCAVGGIHLFPVVAGVTGRTPAARGSSSESWGTFRCYAAHDSRRRLRRIAASGACPQFYRRDGDGWMHGAAVPAMACVDGILCAGTCHCLAGDSLVHARQRNSRTDLLGMVNGLGPRPHRRGLVLAGQYRSIYPAAD